MLHLSLLQLNKINKFSIAIAIIVPIIITTTKVSLEENLLSIKREYSHNSYFVYVYNMLYKTEIIIIIWQLHTSKK